MIFWRIQQGLSTILRLPSEFESQWISNYGMQCIIAFDVKSLSTASNRFELIDTLKTNFFFLVFWIVSFVSLTHFLMGVDHKHIIDRTFDTTKENASIAISCLSHTSEEEEEKNKDTKSTFGLFSTSFLRVFLFVWVKGNNVSCYVKTTVTVKKTIEPALKCNLRLLLFWCSIELFSTRVCYAYLR